MFCNNSQQNGVVLQISKICHKNACFTHSQKQRQFVNLSSFNILLSTVYNWCTEGTKGLDQNHNWLSGGLDARHEYDAMT